MQPRTVDKEGLFTPHTESDAARVALRRSRYSKALCDSAAKKYL